MTLPSYATSRMADPSRDREALVRAWGRPRQPDYGPVVYVYGAINAAPALKRVRLHEKRVYEGTGVVALDEIPLSMPNRDAVLPRSQKGWELVSEQLYRSKAASAHYVVQIRHAECGTTRYVARSHWLRGTNLGTRCNNCFRAMTNLGRLKSEERDAAYMRIAGLSVGRKRETCAGCGAPVPDGQYCSPACGTEGKCGETTMRFKEHSR